MGVQAVSEFIGVTSMAVVGAIFAIVGMTAAIVIASLPFILAGHILQWMFG